MTEAKRSPRPTMKDVAAQVGVSIKTVSRVLNGEAGASPQTREAILRVAADVGFRRNDLARALRSQGGQPAIGVVTNNLSTRFFEGLISGISEVAAAHEALVLVTAAQSAEREESALAALSSRRLDGVIVMSSVSDLGFLRAEQAAGFPMVFVDSPATGITADAVLANNQAGAAAGVRHLISHGHQRIAFVGSGGARYTVQERLAGYREALQGNASMDENLIVLDCRTAERARQAAEDMIASTSPPTAVFAANSVCAIGVARALRAAGLAHHVALVGFDDFDPADLLDPPLSVVAQNPVAIGRHAAEMLFARIDGTDNPPQTRILPVDLIKRGSGEICGPTSHESHRKAN